MAETDKSGGTRRVIYVSRLMKGWEMAQAVKAFKEQELIKSTKQSILKETEVSHAKASFG